MIEDPKRVIRDGYDRLGDAYRPAEQSKATESRGWFLDETLSRISPGVDILELGCGPGWDGRRLADTRRYVGVDISTTMLNLAKERVPEGTFLEGDLTSIELPAHTFDAVVSIYVFGHIPEHEHLPAFHRVASWLRQGGLFAANLPLTPGDEVEPDWRGVPMFFGGIGREATEKGLIEAGFDLQLAEERDNTDPAGGTERFFWVIARRT